MWYIYHIFLVNIHSELVSLRMKENHCLEDLIYYTWNTPPKSSKTYLLKYTYTEIPTQKPWHMYTFICSCQTNCIRYKEMNVIGNAYFLKNTPSYANVVNYREANICFIFKMWSNQIRNVVALKKKYYWTVSTCTKLRRTYRKPNATQNSFKLLFVNNTVPGELYREDLCLSRCF